MTVIDEDGGDLRSGKVDWPAVSCIAIFYLAICVKRGGSREKKSCAQALLGKGGRSSSTSLWERPDDGFGH